MNTLAEVIANPEVLAKIPREDIPALLLEISAVQGRLAAKLLEPSEQTNSGNVDKLLDITEAATKLAVTEDWLYRKGSKLPFVVRMGRNVRFSEKGIEKYIRQRIGH